MQLYCENLKLIDNNYIFRTSTENDISDNEKEFQIKVTTEADLFVKGFVKISFVHFSKISNKDYLSFGVLPSQRIMQC